MKRLVLLLALAAPTAAFGHDTWVQTNTNLVRSGDVVHIDLMLGNHGNEHRDFKLAGKLALDGATPRGHRAGRDAIRPEGPADRHGLHAAGGLLDDPVRAGRARPLHGRPPLRPGDELRPGAVDQERQDLLRRRAEPRQAAGRQPRLRPAARPRPGVGPGRQPGHADGAGTPIRVRLLYKGKPLAGERVSFIPRGATLKRASTTATSG